MWFSVTPRRAALTFVGSTAVSTLAAGSQIYRPHETAADWIALVCLCSLWVMSLVLFVLMLTDMLRCGVPAKHKSHDVLDMNDAIRCQSQEQHQAQ